MDDLARDFCSGYVAEAWRTGFAAGAAVIFGVVVLVHLLMRIFDGTWESFSDKRHGECKSETKDV